MTRCLDEDLTHNPNPEFIQDGSVPRIYFLADKGDLGSGRGSVSLDYYLLFPYGESEGGID